MSQASADKRQSRLGSVRVNRLSGSMHIGGAKSVSDAVFAREFHRSSLS